MNIVYIHELKVDTLIGHYAWERVIKQPLLISLELNTDVPHIASTDNLDDAIDYAKMVTSIKEFLDTSSFQLLETLTEKLAVFIENKFKVKWLRLKVAKPGAIPQAKEVGVVIERGTQI